MNKQEIQNSASQIVRKEVREGNLGRYAEAVLLWLPKIASAVDTDKKMVVDCVKSAVNDSNPLNTVFGLFGVQLVSEKGLERSPASQSILDNALNLDEVSLQASIQGLSKALKQLEEETASQECASRRSIAQLRTQLDTMQQGKARAEENYNGLQKRIADRLQYILALMGQSPNDDPVYLQVQEMVADMGAKVVWDSENGPLPASAMFQTYKSDNPNQQLRKPCLLCSETVIAQGVLFEQG